MRTYATAQNIGTRSHQCDATAVRTVNGVRAYALADGIGSDNDVRDWTRAATIRLARTTARHRDADTGMAMEYERYANDPARSDPYMHRYMPKAAAVVAVFRNQTLTVAWAGDARAYLTTRNGLIRLTDDHNLRRVYPPQDAIGGGNRNVLTSCLGDAPDDIDTDDILAAADAECMQRYRHPAVETTTLTLTTPARLILASDGAYEPIEDNGGALDAYATGTPQHAARSLVREAIRRADPHHTDNATALVADLHP